MHFGYAVTYSITFYCAEYVTLFFVMSIVEDELIRLHQSSIMKGIVHFPMYSFCTAPTVTKVIDRPYRSALMAPFAINKPITLQNKNSHLCYVLR